MRVRSWALLVLALGCLAPAALAQHAGRPPDRAAELKALMDQFGKARGAFFQEVRNAKTDAEREQLFKSKDPTLHFLPRFQALEKRARGTETGAQALTWILQEAGRPGGRDAARQALAILKMHYLQSPAIERIVSSLGFMAGNAGEAETADALRALAAGSPHRRVKAAATFALGTMLAGGLMHPSGAKPPEARTLFETVTKEYADTPYAKRAEAYLFEVDHLQIGMKAPDFETTDQDGTPFKLSEYQGKVVVLDFWGFW